MGDKIIRTPVKEEKSFINRELDPPLTELQTVCDVGWTHRGHEQLVMEYEVILRGEWSLMPKSYMVEGIEHEVLIPNIPTNFQ
ncbi:hypothetical protein TNCV_3002731 [Trichonephila clavipes]|nr:hypothetical protein TNCV_3002731 [Trichonephila clavipes]